MPHIYPYLGYGSPNRVLALGRVVRGAPLPPAAVTDSAWRNARNMLRRLRPRPLAGARLRVVVGASTFDVSADDEGFVKAWLELPTSVLAGGRVPIGLQLLDDVGEAREATEEVRATADALVPSSEAAFGVISDIDDTVIQSHVTDFARAARTVLLGNARTRLPFPGVAAFYRALERGVSAVPPVTHGSHAARNPIFFVSSSPWNLHDFITEFMALQGLPTGPLLLRDWDLGRSLLKKSGHHGHKGLLVREILDTYPHLKFILVGDSGEQDPEIYREVVRDYPSRILAVYIRDVTTDESRDAAVRGLYDEVREAGSELLLLSHTLDAAKHAAERGWIDASVLDEIAHDARKDVGVEPGKEPAPGAQSHVTP